MLPFIVGLMLGGIVGIFMMCLATVAKEADAHIEDCDYEVIEEKSEDPKKQGGCPK